MTRSGQGTIRKLRLPQESWTSLSLLLLLAAPSLAIAQVPAPTSRATQDCTATTTCLPDSSQAFEDSNVSRSLRGAIASLTMVGVHDSIVGWATLATPSFSYTFNNIFSADAAIPIYMYRLAESRSTHPKPNAHLVNQRGEPGDIILGLHAQFQPVFALYQITTAMTVPTGDQKYGLSTGRVTFDLNNHFEQTFGRFTPNLEVGTGDSTTLVNRIVTKNYTSLGPLAHFQVGLGMNLFHGAYFESDAYEQLPIGDQKIYGPVRKHRPTVVIGHNVSEDNGFINSLSFPIDRHTTISGYYSRSLRLYTDTAGVNITYVLRAGPVEEEPLDDLLR